MVAVTPSVGPLPLSWALGVLGLGVSWPWALALRLGLMLGPGLWPGLVALGSWPASGDGLGSWALDQQLLLLQGLAWALRP